MNSCWCHSSSKAHAMGSCGTAVGTILLKDLLGHGLATHNEPDSAVLGTLDTFFWDSVLCWAPLIACLMFFSEACQGDHYGSLFVRQNEMAKATLVSWRLSCIQPVSVYSFYSSSNTLPLLQIYIDKPRSPKLWSKSQEYVTVSFGACVCVCVSVCLSSSDNAGGYSFWLSALMFAHLCSCSHTHRWNTVSWQQSKINHNWWINSGVSLPLVCARTIMPQVKHMLWALVAQLWPFSWRGVLVTAWLPTMNAILFCWAPLMPCFGITSLKLAREITPSPAKIMVALVSCRFGCIQRLFVLFFILHSLFFECTWMTSGVGLPLVGGRTITLRAKHMPFALVAQLTASFSRRSCLVTA